MKFLLFLLFLCASSNAQLAPENFLFVIADDAGVDMVSAYAEHPDAPPTPTIDALAAEGVLFRNAWSSPTCSPTRAGLMTGEYAFRTGIGTKINYELAPGSELSLAYPTLPGLLRSTYLTVLIGKWHLTSQGTTGPMHPVYAGFDFHAGPISNVNDAGGTGFYDWTKFVNGVPYPQTAYVTTSQVDDAILGIGAGGLLPEPWCVLLSFNDPHGPFPLPPAHLHTYGTPTDKPTKARAKMQALDAELGRLLASMHPDVLARTWVVFLGDNGTAGPVALPPYSSQKVKPSVYEGGVNVPLIVRGPGVVDPGREVESVVQTLDLFATVFELLGAPIRTTDSVSLVPYFTDALAAPQREWVYTERFTPNGLPPDPDTWHRAVRGERYKLIRFPSHDEFYDLLSDPFENENLHGDLDPAEQSAYDALSDVLTLLGVS